MYVAVVVIVRQALQPQTPIMVTTIAITKSDVRHEINFFGFIVFIVLIVVVSDLDIYRGIGFLFFEQRERKLLVSFPARYQHTSARVFGFRSEVDSNAASSRHLHEHRH